ncbi:unnamed protein product [Arctogadus glacialis]
MQLTSNQKGIRGLCVGQLGEELATGPWLRNSLWVGQTAELSMTGNHFGAQTKGEGRVHPHDSPGACSSGGRVVTEAAG